LAIVPESGRRPRFVNQYEAIMGGTAELPSGAPGSCFADAQGPRASRAAGDEIEAAEFE
jgi:hypothetical protein